MLSLLLVSPLVGVSSHAFCGHQLRSSHRAGDSKKSVGLPLLPQEQGAPSEHVAFGNWIVLLLCVAAYFGLNIPDVKTVSFLEELEAGFPKI